jgi:hypothetical protein
MDAEEIKSYNETAEKCLKITPTYPNFIGAISCYDWIGNKGGLEHVLALAKERRNITAIEAAEDALKKYGGAA